MNSIAYLTYCTASLVNRITLLVNSIAYLTYYTTSLVKSITLFINSIAYLTYCTASIAIYLMACAYHKTKKSPTFVKDFLKKDLILRGECPVDIRFFILSHITAVPSAQSGLTSLFEMLSREPRHLKLKGRSPVGFRYANFSSPISIKQKSPSLS